MFPLVEKLYAINLLSAYRVKRRQKLQLMISLHITGEIPSTCFHLFSFSRILLNQNDILCGSEHSHRNGVIPGCVHTTRRSFTQVGVQWA